MSIALAAMSDLFIQGAQAAQIPLEVLHRVVSMASGGMDTLPHNGAVITLLAVTGLTHRQSYRDIFAVTMIKTMAVFFVIFVFYATGLRSGNGQSARQDRAGHRLHQRHRTGHRRSAGPRWREHRAERLRRCRRGARHNRGDWRAIGPSSGGHAQA
jgi:acid phosphatase family membrane protein YuiD